MVCLRHIGVTVGAEGRGVTIAGTVDDPQGIDLVEHSQERPIGILVTGGRCVGNQAWLLGWSRTAAESEGVLTALGFRDVSIGVWTTHSLQFGGSRTFAGHPAAPDSFDSRGVVHDRFSFDLEFTDGGITARDLAASTTRTFGVQLLLGPVGVEIGPFLMVKSLQANDADVPIGYRPVWEARIGADIALDVFAGIDERAAAPMTWDDAGLFALAFTIQTAQVRQMAYVAAAAAFLSPEEYFVGTGILGLGTLPPVFATHDAFFDAARDPQSALPAWAGLAGEGAYLIYAGARAIAAEAGPQRESYLATTLLAANLLGDGAFRAFAPAAYEDFGPGVRAIAVCGQAGASFAVPQGERAALAIHTGSCANELLFKPLGRHIGFLPDTERTLW